MSVYRDPNLEMSGVRRIVLLPTENETEFAKAAPRFREQLAAQLKATGLFDVVAPPEEAFGDCETHLLARDAVPANLLADMARDFNADAILLSAVTDYHPYSPPRLGTTVHLVSTRDAVTLVTVDGIWDARDAAVAEAARQFSQSFTLPGGAPATPSAVIDTPAYFEVFVARQVAAAFAPPVVPAEQTRADGVASRVLAPQRMLRDAIRKWR